jgi:TonB family protein
MNSLVWSVVSCVVNSVWEVCVIGAAGWAVSRLLKRLGAQAEHVVWVATLILAVVTPTLPLWRRLLGFLYASAGIREHSSVASVILEGARTSARSAALLSPMLHVVLLVLYVIVLLYFAGRLGWSLYLTLTLLREATPLSLDPNRERVWDHCRREVSVTNARVQQSEWISGPVTVAFGKPILLLPPGFSEQCNDSDFLAAIAHEAVHMLRRDFQKNLLYEIASLVIAFHPVTWMVKSKIAQSREMICDEVATRGLIDSHSYSRSLLRLATIVSLSSRANSFHAIGIFDANILEKRIMTVNAKKKNLNMFLRYGLMVPAAALLFAVAAGAGAMAVTIAPQMPSQPYGQVYKIGKDVSAPKLISSVEPVYPESARTGKDKFEGSCVVGMVVDASGMPRDVHVVRSLAPAFDASAMKAVQQYRFEPAMRVGEQVAVSVNVEMNFKKF